MAGKFGLTGERMGEGEGRRERVYRREEGKWGAAWMGPVLILSKIPAGMRNHIQYMHHTS